MKSIIKRLAEGFHDWRMLRRGLTFEEQVKAVQENDSVFLHKVILKQRLDKEALDVLFPENYRPREDSLGYIYYQKYGLENERMLKIIRHTSVEEMGLPKTLIRQFNLFYSGCSPEEERELAIFLLSNEDEEMMNFFRSLEKIQDCLREIDIIGLNNKYADVIKLKKEAFERKFSKLIPSNDVQKRILDTGYQPLILLTEKELGKVEAWYWGHLNERRRFLIEAFGK